MKELQSSLEKALALNKKFEKETAETQQKLLTELNDEKESHALIVKKMQQETQAIKARM